MKKLFSLALVLMLLCTAVCSAAINSAARSNAQKLVDYMNKSYSFVDGFITFDSVYLEEDDSIYYNPSNGKGLCQIICSDQGAISLRFVSRDKETSFMCTTMLLAVAGEFFSFNEDTLIQWFDQGYKTLDSNLTSDGDYDMLSYELGGGSRIMLYGNNDEGEMVYICALESGKELIANW